MNASGRLNTCKSNGKAFFGEYTSGERVSNAYATYLLQGNSPEKFGLMSHSFYPSPEGYHKAPAVKDGHA